MAPPDDDTTSNTTSEGQSARQRTTRKAAAARRQPSLGGGRGTVGRPITGKTGSTTSVVGRSTVLSDEQRAAVRAAVLGLDPLTDEQVAAVCEVIVASRAKRRDATAPGVATG